MRNGSRIIAMLLAFVMVFTYPTPVQAEDLPEESTLFEQEAGEWETDEVSEDDLDMGQIEDEFIEEIEEPVQEEEESGEDFVEPVDEASSEKEDESFAETSGDYTYSLSGEEATITKYTGTTETSISIPGTIDGYTVTKLGNSVFYNHKEITAVVIPSSVTSIGNYCFQNCTALESVNLPTGLTELGYEAFYKCQAITSVTLPDTLTKIGGSCFGGCTSLTSITIPKGIQDIDSNAFSDVVTAVFEAGIEAVPQDSFNGAKKLQRVTIPSSVTQIGNSAFNNCIALEAVAIPSGVTQIGNYAFQKCSALTAITLPEGLTKVGYNAFTGCSGIESITIPKSLTEISSNAFDDVKKVTFESGTETIPANALNGARKLTEVVIPSSVTSIGNSAFYNCQALESVTLPTGVTQIGNSVFYNCKALGSVTLPSGLTEIGNYAFQNCSALTAITLPSGLTRIGYSAFAGCTGIESITIPKSLTEISSNTFDDVKKVIFENGTETIPANALNGARKLTEVVIPSTVTSIGNSAFYNCQALEAVTLPSGLTQIGNYVFYNCKALGSVTLPGGLTEIGNYAFQNCVALTEIKLPGSLTKVGYSAFAGCTGIESITIPMSLTDIGNGAFSPVKKVAFEEGFENIPNNCLSSCQNLTEITLPSTIKSIGNSAFQSCKALTSVELPKSLENIGNYAFEYCEGLTEIVIPDSVTTYGYGIFSGCKKLEKVTLPQTLISLGSSTFNNCSSLKEIKFPSGMTTIGSSCFSRCEALESVEIPDGVTVEYNGFSYCTGLKKVVFGNNVTLKGSVFYNCSNIEEIVAGENFVFNKSDFSGLTTSGTIGDITWTVEDLSTGILTISGEGSIPDYENLTERPWHKIMSFITDIKISGSDITIGKNAFASMNNLESVIMGEGVVKISENAFKDCTKLIFAELSPDLEKIEDGAFAGCTAFEQLILTSETAPDIEDEAFGAIDILDIFFPFSGVGYTNYLITRFGKITWNPFDDTNGGQEIMLVLDVSGSMSGERIKGLREAATAFVENVGGIQNNTKISIVAFDDNAELIANATYFQAGLVHQISLLTDRGGTEYKEALECADSVLSQSKTKHKYLVMFSDGEPNDNREAIYAYAETLRKKYGIFTVGLGTRATQREVLEKVAGSEKRYFEASNVAALIEVFKNLAEDIDKEEYTKVEIHRNSNWYDVRHNLVKYVVDSKEDATIKVTPSLGTKNVAKFALAQYGNPTSRRESVTGEFLLVPGDRFRENYDRDTGTINSSGAIYVEVIDTEGNVVDTVDTNLAMTDAFRVTYMRNDDSGIVEHTQLVKPWTFFEYDGEIPSREDLFFDGWYEDENASSEYNYFSIRNRKKRYTIEDDITLYAKWRDTDFSFDFDAWGFGNNPDVYCTDDMGDYAADASRTTHTYQYDIRESDFKALKNGYSNAQKKTFDEEKEEYWEGSCFGMAATSMFYNRGLLDLANFDNSKTSPSTVTAADMPYSEVGAFESLINYYFLLQFDPEISALRGNYKGINVTGGESENLERIINRFEEDNSPKMLMIKLYTKSSPATSVGGHAVVIYNFQRKGNDRYSFSIYDNSHNEKPYSLEVYKDTDGLYKRECKEYEDVWGYRILFRVVLSAQEMLDNTHVLSAPAVVLNEHASLAEATADEYILTTSYPDFEITDGTDSAVITGGEKTSGSLNITCNGVISDVNAAAKYEFVLPVLADGKQYMVSSQSGAESSYETEMKYDNAVDGFFSSVDAEDAGIITIGNQGNVTTAFTGDVTHTVSATNNKINMPWYDLVFTTTDKGATLQISDDKFHVETATADKKADIRAHGDINFVEFKDVTIPAGGVDVKETSGDCVIATPSGTAIDSKPYGFCVIFDTQGGSDVETLYNVAADSLVEEPEKPVKEGFIFEGWFKDKDCTTVWDFANDKVTADTVIYAGWSFNENYYKTVTFIMKDGSQQRIHVLKKSVLSPEKCPVIEGVKAQNWYKDEERTILWDFENDTVDDDVTLYCEIGRFTVDFETDGAGTIESMIVPEGTKVTEPEKLYKEGYTFCGWFKDNKFQEEWNFEVDTVAGDMTLFAKWVATEIDKNDKDTQISIEIVHPYGYIYTGKAVTPQVIVRDGETVLTEKKDYKISFKNNKQACDLSTTTVSDSQKPQIIVKGVGIYKNEKPITEYFSIMQADMADLEITVQKYVAVKAGGQVQTISPTVKNEGKVVDKKLYTVNYYTDKALTQKVSGITTAGLYYVVIEALKDGTDYTGNYKGVSDSFEVLAGDQDKLVSGMKVTFNKNVSAVSDALTKEETIKKLIKKVVIAGKTYDVSGSGYEQFANTFDVIIEDADENSYEGEDLWKGIRSSGSILVLIAAKEGNAEGYIGSTGKNYTLKGRALKAGQFTLSYTVSAKKPVTKASYTGKKNLPGITTELIMGKDFTVSYMKGNEVITAEQVVDAGTYKAVITGKGNYSGKVTLPFAITKLDLAEAAAEGRLEVSYEGSAVYDPKGSAPEFTVICNRKELVPGVDYTISYANNKKATTDKTYAYAKIKGTGNFTGSISGDGKTSPTSSATLKKGKVAGCNFSISRKSLSSSDITFVLQSVKKDKKGKVKSVKFKLYDGTKAIGKGDYTARKPTGSGSYIYQSISGKGNYTGSRYESIQASLTSVKNSKKVKIAIKNDGKFYYTGSGMYPEITVTDAEGNDISYNVTITYDENTNVGTGKIYISGIASKGYCGRKTVTFPILPKWAQWIFG